MWRLALHAPNYQATRTPARFCALPGAGRARKKVPLLHTDICITSTTWVWPTWPAALFALRRRTSSKGPAVWRNMGKGKMQEIREVSKFLIWRAMLKEAILASRLALCDVLWPSAFLSVHATKERNVSQKISVLEYLLEITSAMVLGSLLCSGQGPCNFQGLRTQRHEFSRDQRRSPGAPLFFCPLAKAEIYGCKGLEIWISRLTCTLRITERWYNC